ncbi:MAG: hypothetical protein JRJ86_02945 [Deltaproteobacteria bacterium]|nr:hypothetical protein [Deltaproteobacteria bacterium]MBW2117118.1 hypothetical protein [Deltaproteobacteria bacterium]MBW2344449.1 hypothetical protein [Deltaproteobacteria bacterium]
MKKGLLFPFLLVLCFSLFCCAKEEKTEKKEILARINDYELALKDFEFQLVDELEMDQDFKLTREARKEFLDQLIRKELLIQEAKRLKLDRKKNFVRTIERYWESTLIRNLMELKGKEISKRTVVAQEEIESRYEKMKKSDPDLAPLKNMQEKVAGQILEEKKRKRLVAWINELRKDAKIEIDQELLSKDR